MPIILFLLWQMHPSRAVAFAWNEIAIKWRKKTTLPQILQKVVREALKTLKRPPQIFFLNCIFGYFAKMYLLSLKTIRCYIFSLTVKISRIVITHVGCSSSQLSKCYLPFGLCNGFQMDDCQARRTIVEASSRSRDAKKLHDYLENRINWKRPSSLSQWFWANTAVQHCRHCFSAIKDDLAVAISWTY